MFGSMYTIIIGYGPTIPTVVRVSQNGNGAMFGFEFVSRNVCTPFPTATTSPSLSTFAHTNSVQYV